MTDKEERAPQNGADITQEVHDNTIDFESAKEELKEVVDAITKNPNDEGQSVITEVSDNLFAMMRATVNAVEWLSKTFPPEKIMTAQQRISAVFNEYRDIFNLFASLPDNIAELAPYIAEELRALAEERKEEGEFEEKTIPELLAQGYDKDGNPTSGLFAQALERARKRAAEDEDQDLEPEVPRVTASPVLSIKYPIDKVNNTIWSLLDTEWNKGTVNIDIDTTSEDGKKKGKEAIVALRLCLDSIEAQTLDEYDKRIYIAYSALYDSGNPCFSASQIYAEMGNEGKPSADAIQKINDSLSKMRTTTLFMDNQKEVEVNKSTPLYSIVDTSLLPFIRESKYINNTYCESAIVPLMEPPLYTFAKGRGQIATISRELLRSPVNKTKNTLAIEDYLLYRISRMKNKNNKRPIKKILFKTLFDNCHITDRRNFPRTRETVYRYLDHYKKQGEIKGYSKETDGVTIIV